MVHTLYLCSICWSHNTHSSLLRATQFFFTWVFVFQLLFFQSDFCAVNSERWDPAGRSGDLKVHRQYHSYSYTVTHFTPLMGFQKFYRSERSALGDFLLLPDTLDKWAESHQKGLLGYQEQANMFLSKRREGSLLSAHLLRPTLPSDPHVLSVYQSSYTWCAASMSCWDLYPQW